MSQTVVIDFVAPEPEPTPAHRRIRQVSRGLSWLFTGLLVLWGLFCALLLVAFLIPFVGRYVGIGPTGMLLTTLPHLPPRFVSFADLPLLQRLAHVPVGLINFMPPLAIFFGLRQLFGLYARGVVFSRDNARCIQWIGVALVAHAVAPGLGVAFLTAIHISPEELVLGAVVYVIALVMQVGHEIEEERGQFV
jgi:hypothetical protein